MNYSSQSLSVVILVPELLEALILAYNPRAKPTSTLLLSLDEAAKVVTKDIILFRRLAFVLNICSLFITQNMNGMSRDNGDISFSASPHKKSYQIVVECGLQNFSELAVKSTPNGV